MIQDSVCIHCDCKQLKQVINSVAIKQDSIHRSEVCPCHVAV